MQVKHPSTPTAVRPRRSTGGIVERTTSRGISYHVRFRAAGVRQSVYVGHKADGVTRRDAQRVLAYELERVARGEWAPRVEVSPVRAIPTFREAASDWFAARKIEGGRKGEGLREASVADLEWRLGHLLRGFAATPIDRIDVAAVDNYRRRLVREGKLGARSINMTLAALASVLEEALEQGTITGRNPALGKRRRLPVERPRRTYIDRAEQITALLDAAGALDRERGGVPNRRAALATLVLGGLRIGELLDLRWSDVHLASGRLYVRRGKTATAERSVDLLPLLRDELVALAAVVRSDADQDAYVFATSTGARQQATNLRQRVLAPAVEGANKQLAKRGAEPLPSGLTPHSLRRTFASLLYALGESPSYVMAQMGHTSPNLALAIYAKVMDRRDGEPERLATVVGRPYRATTGNRMLPNGERESRTWSAAA
jgi:integrase